VAYGMAALQALTVHLITLLEAVVLLVLMYSAVNMS
jgi:hypothetical protein